MTTRGSYRTLDLATKVKILKEAEKGGAAKQDLARKYGIKPNSLSTFVKNKCSILMLLRMVNSRCLKENAHQRPPGVRASASGGDSSCPTEEAETSELDDNGLAAALGDVRFEEYVAVDSTAETSGALMDIEIIESVRLREASNESEIDDDFETEPQPPAADVAAGLALAQQFFAAENNAEEALGHIYSLQNLLSA
ncbi:hypothetical protein HPB47_008915, partial [Ixodes persulcatus]